MSPAEERTDIMLDIYGIIIPYVVKLSGGYKHTNIMNTIRSLSERDIDEQRSIRMTLRKYNHYIEKQPRQ